ncbi:MAG: DUF2188 domain-containing protein [Candidatus Methanomethylophilaceae archaeon]|jgi:hypothetical protein
MTPANAEKPDSDGKETKPKSNSKTYRIVRDKEKNKWRVKADGAKRAIGYYNTKVEAEQKVKELKAKNKEAKVSVHKMDGKFQKQK